MYEHNSCVWIKNNLDYKLTDIYGVYISSDHIPFVTLLTKYSSCVRYFRKSNNSEN